MGKPRRCSQAFFAEERGELDRKRGKIRLLQQRKMADTASWADLPNEVPLQLVIGSKVDPILDLKTFNFKEYEFVVRCSIFYVQL